MSIIVMNSYEFTERRKHFEHVYVESDITIIIQFYSIPRFFHRISISFEISLQASINRLQWKQNGIAKLKFKIYIR